MIRLRSDRLGAWQHEEKLILDYQSELEQITKDLPRLEREKNETEKQYQQAFNKQTQAKAIGRARALLSSVEDALAKIQAEVRECARKDVERAMNEFYAPLLLKNYCIRLTEDFHHKIIDESNGVGRMVVGIKDSLEIIAKNFM
jgi:DNA repair exonuclease SbcCD ATPase subunit